MSERIYLPPPRIDRIMIRLKKTAISASKIPTRISLPQGAGKCPIIKVELSPDRNTKARTKADMHNITVKSPMVRRLAYFPLRTEQVTPPARHMIILKKGKF